jgi:murein DD-endopeptidase MepM/ murein hydrolase activator NlpD
MLKKIETFLRKYSWTVAAGIALLGVVLLLVATCIQRRGVGETEPDAEPLTMYDIAYEQYEIVEGEVENGVPMGKLLERFGIGPGGTYRIDQTARQNDIDITKIKAGQRYVAFMAPDTLSTDTIARPRLAHFAYEVTPTDYWVISLPTSDSIVVRKGSKPIRIERRHIKATIESSMWMAINSNGLPDALSAELEDIFGWSVDFFALQKGDNFEVIFDQRYTDTTRLTSGSIGQIWGAVFHHDGKQLYAIPFMQDGKIAYWDENGNSLKKQFLKAPLNSSRISSHFSGARRHPITRIIRPHNGVDYPAPTGTPVHAVANGTVTRRGWMSGGGNSVIVKHARGYETRYLHLSKYANVAVGSRVSQGQTIGYVGSTGQSTGPHLHYEIRVNGKAINPLKIPQEPGEPIKAANRNEFSVVRAKVMGELAGTLPEAQRLMRLDSIAIPDGPLEAVNPSPVDTTQNAIDGARR